jgi:hypothetical protein
LPELPEGELLLSLRPISVAASCSPWMQMFPWLFSINLPINQGLMSETMPKPFCNVTLFLQKNAAFDAQNKCSDELHTRKAIRTRITIDHFQLVAVDLPTNGRPVDD